MFKKLMVAAALSAAMFPACAWDLWDSFKEANLEGSRVVDYSDTRRITTSEGQSYGMFFALVAGDREGFDKLARWTEDNLAGGDLTKTLPSWLWGREYGAWGTIDSNNAADSDMWIAWAFLEAGRLWKDPAYTAKGKAMLALLKTQVRTVENLGDVILPGRKGFEKDGVVKLNPSYYPLFILKRFALEDAAWQTVYEGSLRMLLRSAPSGFSPDWARFDRHGRFMTPEDKDCSIGSYNAIRSYLWAGLMSPSDPAYDRLRRQFAPMVRMTREMNMPPEDVNVIDGTVNDTGNAGFGACLLPLLGNDRTAGLIRTVLRAKPVSRDSYYSNVLILYALGFDERRYAFDEAGRLIFPRADLAPVFTTADAPAAAPAPVAGTPAAK